MRVLLLMTAAVVAAVATAVPGATVASPAAGPVSVHLKPDTATKMVGETHTLTATGCIGAGDVMTWEVTGANPTNGPLFILANQDGTANFSYDGFNAGTDTITITVPNPVGNCASNTDTATAEWVAPTPTVTSTPTITPTATPCPPAGCPVGGVAEAPGIEGRPLKADGSSGVPAGAMAGAAAGMSAGAAALGGAVWFAYARRRR